MSIKHKIKIKQQPEENKDEDRRCCPLRRAG